MEYYYQNQQEGQQGQDGEQQQNGEQQQYYQNYNDGMVKQGLVRFTLCTEGCGSCSGEYAVDMMEFLDAYTESKMDTLEYQCEMIRERCVIEGLDSALERRKRNRERSRRLDGEGEAQLITLACSEAPRGSARWTLRMLADKLIELEIVDTISHESVRQVLKKHHKTLEEDVVHRGGK